VFVAALLICGEPTAPHSLAFGQEPDPDLVAIPVTGTERLEWDQFASSATELARLRFVIYVDNAPIDAADVACGSEPGPAGFSCSAQLPSLTPGPHFVDVSAVRVTPESEESPRSAAISLLVKDTSEITKASPAGAHGTFVTTDGIKLNTSILATGLVDATDLAVLGGGRIAIAERAGRIRLFEPGAGSLGIAATLTDLDASAPGSGLLAIAASGRFDPTGTIYVVYTTARGTRLARYAADDHGLSARAILLDGLPVSTANPHMSMRIGPDRKLYLALDDGGDAERVDDLGSMSGKVLRLNLDGTTPSDSGSRVYATGLNHPTAMAWSADASMFWISGFDSAGLESLNQMAGVATATRRDTAAQFRLPSSTGKPAVLTYQSESRSPLNGNLLIAGDRSRSILRARIAAKRTIERAESLFDGTIDGVRAMALDPSGAIYMCTANSLIRIAVQN
jgi:glucose/arabinose dehydrogenase